MFILLADIEGTSAEAIFYGAACARIFAYVEVQAGNSFGTTGTDQANWCISFYGVTLTVAEILALVDPWGKSVEIYVQPPPA